MTYLKKFMFEFKTSRRAARKAMTMISRLMKK